MPGQPLEPVILKPNWPALSKAARRLVILAAPWCFGSLLAADALGLIGRDDPQTQRWLAVLVATAPAATLVFHPWLGRVRGFRWLHHQTQPRLSIGANGLDLRLPEVGEHLYGWDEVGGLRMRRDHSADLMAVNGVPLARIPESLIMAGGGWWRSQSVASVVVRARPDRYRISGANWAGEPNEFALRATGEPMATIGPFATRRRLVTAAIWLSFGVVTVVLVARFLSA